MYLVCICSSQDLGLSGDRGALSVVSEIGLLDPFTPRAEQKTIEARYLVVYL